MGAENEKNAGEKDTSRDSAAPEKNSSAKSSTSAGDKKAGAFGKSSQTSGKSVSPSGIKKNLTDKATQGAMGAAPESVQKGVEAAKKVVETTQKAIHVGAAIGKAATTAAAALTNPATWIAIVVVAALAIGGLGIMSTTQTLGQNENANGCYGIGGNATSTVDIGDEGSSDWTQRANAMGSWLMSQKFNFLGGKGMSKEQAAAVVGNYVQESGVTFAKAERKDGNESGAKDKMSNEEAQSWTSGGARGLGLAQWTWNPGRAGNLIKKANELGKNWYDAESQLALMKDELDASYGSRLLGAGFGDSSKDLGDLTIIFHNVYEGSADGAAGLQERKDSAQDFYGKFTGGGSFGGSTGGSCTKGNANVDTSSVVGLAISLSYPTTEESRVSGGDSYGVSLAKPEYKAAKQKAMDETGADPMPTLYASCDRFVATVIRLTIDKEIPWGDTSAQGNYLANSPKWQQYTSKSEAKPGDIWVTRTGGHIILYIGDYNGQDSIAHASYLDRVAGIGSSSYLNENLVDTGGRSYYGYHFVG